MIINEISSTTLLPISIFQSTKANHNKTSEIDTGVRAVANLNISKYETKSQRRKY